MGYADVLRRRSFGETMRRDAWWVQPLVTFLAFSAFIVYATWAAFQGANYRSGGYLSPLYSPEIWGDAESSWFGGKPDWWPGWFPWSAAFFILWAPGGFRLTCYYYRGAYYQESRGAQFREDYPEKDETFGEVNMVVRRGPYGEMQVSREPIPALSAELAAIIEEMK